MKYIFIILICFFSLAGYSQVQKVQRSGFGTQVDSSVAPGKNFIMPVFQSFSQLATYTVLDSTGRQVFIRDSNAVFYRNNQHQWVKFATGTGGATSPGGTRYAVQYNDNGSFGGDTTFSFDPFVTGNIYMNNVGETQIFSEGKVIVASPTADNKSNLYLENLHLSTPTRIGSPIGITDSGEIVKINVEIIPDTSFTGVTNVIVDTINNSICVYIGTTPTCYPLAGDSVRVVGDTSICVYTNGIPDCYASNGDTLIVTGGIDSFTINGNTACAWDNGSSICFTINNGGQYVTIGVLSADSSAYDFYGGGTYMFSLPTLLRSLIAGSGIYISDTTIDGKPYTVIYNTGSAVSTWQSVVTATASINASSNVVAQLPTDGGYYGIHVPTDQDETGLYVFSAGHPLNKTALLGIYDSTTQVIESGVYSTGGENIIKGSVSIIPPEGVDTALISLQTPFRNNEVSTDSSLVIDIDGLVKKRGISGGTTDSVQIGNDWFFTTKVTLTPTEINSLNTTPVLAIAAPGAGKAIDIISATVYLDYNSSAYASGASLLLTYGGTDYFGNGVFNISGGSSVGAKLNSIEGSDTFTPNTDINIKASADNSDGDSNVSVYIYYRVTTL